MPTSNPRFVWYELMTGDVPAAEAFYKRVIGWESHDAGLAAGPYTVMLAAGAGVAGVMRTPAELQAIGVRAAWSGYIGVDDVQAMAARLERAGGHVLRPAADIPGVGRFAVVTDPQGAEFMLFQPQPSDAPPPPAPGTPGTVGWHELHADDGPAAVAFYSDLFGWTAAEAIDMGKFGVYQTFEIDGVLVAGIMTRMPDTLTSGWRYYFRVEAADAATARVVGAGGRVTSPPHQVHNGDWIAHAVDPQGAEFRLVASTR